MKEFNVPAFVVAEGKAMVSDAFARIREGRARLLARTYPGEARQGAPVVVTPPMMTPPLVVALIEAYDVLLHPFSNEHRNRTGVCLDRIADVLRSVGYRLDQSSGHATWVKQDQ